MTKKFTWNVLLLITVLVCSAELYAQPELEWVRPLGGEESAAGSGIAVDSENNVYSTGYFIGDVDFSTSDEPLILEREFATAYITKHSPEGELIWIKHLSGVGANGGLAIAVDDAVYISGYFSGELEVEIDGETNSFEAAGLYDMFVLKIDPDGEFLWVKAIGGDSDYDWAQVIKTDPNDGSLYIAGNFSGDVDFDPGDGEFELSTLFLDDFNAYILKLSADGEFQWVYELGGTGYDVIQNMAVDPSGFVYATGIFEQTADFDMLESGFEMTSSGYADGFVLKIGTDQTFEWAVQTGDEENDWANGIAIDPAGNVVITGMFDGTMDFDPGIGEEWLTSEGWDVFVWKLSSEGSLVWAKQLGGPSFEWGNAITVDAVGNIYTTGWFNGLADFDPGDEYYFFNGISYYEMFISKLNPDGDFEWAVQVVGDPGSYDNQGTSIQVDADGSVLTTGFFSLTANFDPNDPDFSISAAGISSNGFIYKLSQGESVGLEDNVFAKSLNAFPNPTTNEFTIDLGEVLNLAEIRIFDVAGRLIHSQNVQQMNLVNIQLPASARPGMYFIEVTHENGEQASFKLLKQ